MSNSEQLTPPEIRAAAHNAVESLLPSKSKDRYERQYEKFIAWCQDRKVSKYSENCLLAYFEDLGKKKSLWSIYSMLKSCLNIKDNVNISKFPKLITYLKRKTEHHNPKKSYVLNEEEINRFLSDAPDRQHLLMKAVLVMGISGALRRDELSKMLINHVTFKDDIILVDVPETKTNKSRSFAISKPAWTTIIQQYLIVRRRVTTGSNRLFYTYRNGICINSPVGINTFGKVPTHIAQFLKLKEPERYTGHCFRRSSATLLANKGGDLLSIKRHGGWRSSAVAEGYIEDSVQSKISVAQTLTDTRATTSTAVTMDIQSSSDMCQLSNAGQLVPGVSFSKVDNCTININIFNSESRENK